jgi:hypothetical protein
MAVKPVSKGEPPAACACAAIGMSRKSRKAVFETRETRMCLRHAGERFIGTSGFVNLTSIEQVMPTRLALICFVVQDLFRLT